MKKVFVFDPTGSDKLSLVRGIGRYLELLRETFPSWIFSDRSEELDEEGVFINPFFNFLQPPLALKRLAQRKIAVIHDLITLEYPGHFPTGIRGKLNIFLNKLAIRNYDLIVTDSEASKKDIVDILGVPGDKIEVVYPCLPNSFTTDQQHSGEPLINQAGRYCLYVGDATWNKNLVNLEKAIKIINVTCVFLGKVFQTEKVDHPWQRELKEFLAETKDDKRFIFKGFVTDSELIKFYQQATLNVLPSRDEGFGFSWLEAANFNCPTVASDIPVLKEISKNAAFYADPENPQDLADKIGEIYFNKDLKEALGRRAHERSQFFSTKKFREDFLRVIDRVS